MAIREPSFTLGIEEEYLLVDKDSRDLAQEPPPALLAKCQEALLDYGSQVSPEFLRSQIEVGTSVCHTIAEAREELIRLRTTVGTIADEFGLAPIASSTHPFATWRSQQHTDKERYNVLAQDLQQVARRLVICGMRGVNVPRASLRDATIVFDLDGTLVDTAPDLTNALNDALTRRGYAAISQETIRSAVGFGARVMIEEALRHAGAADDIDGLLADFLVHYEANIATESRPFPGAVASLETLAASGTRLAICTNKREYLTRKLLEALGLQHYFQGIAGRDTFAVSKPDPGHLTGVIAQAGGNPFRSVMVGDSDVDIRTAKDASVPSILVSFGYAREALGELVPDAVIAAFILGASPGIRRRR